MEQMSIFSFLEDNKKEAKKESKKPAKREIKKKPVCPEILDRIPKEGTEDSLNDYIAKEQPTCYEKALAYVDEDANVWIGSYQSRYTGEYKITGYYYNGTPCRDRVREYYDLTWKHSEGKLVLARQMQTNEELEEIVAKRYPYAYDHMKEREYSPLRFLMCPYIEILDKAGYGLGKYFNRKYRPNKSEYEMFNRLCKTGTKPANIFKTSKAVYQTLKEEPTIEKWDVYRKMDKQGKITADQVSEAYHRNFGRDELEMMSSVLNAEHEGKKIFTWTSLLNYLQRIDMFEAIPTMEGLGILVDYLRLCRFLGIKPRTDSDSLKREHDVLARMSREKRDEILASKMNDACKKLSNYDYQEQIYFVRGIRDYNDLTDEAKQQVNCVRSYAHAIIEGRSRIFVLRTVKNPDASLVTIEVVNGQIRQKLMAHNRPIYNKSITDFIDRWIKLYRKADEMGVSIEEYVQQNKMAA